MKRENNDFKILVVSVIINMVILFSIPGFRIDKIVDKKLKIGLVTLEKDNKKTTTKAEPKKKPTQIKEEKKEVKKVAKVEEIKKEVKPQVKETKKITLEDLAKDFSKRETELLAINQSTEREVNSDLKKELLDKKSLEEIKKASTLNTEKEISIEKENSVLDKTLDFEMDTNKNIAFEGDGDEELGFKSMVEKNGADGLPSGYRLGVEDGDVVAKWDQENREPKYPESAQLKGMQGKVLLKIQIDEMGRVSSVFIEKGSGVPEINEAIEEIARTWKIYLSKNGLNIKGNVTLEYSFKLLGASS
ncbi:energy transducer TonB [Cetobacterium sp. 8H]|uniref:energy transducer TonB n=1 Tax=Cetobacterium sp. 8H TaxID=2759681 RepID=UPI00163D1BF6|nr:energy transducer TonB [Cetobacterium sp. 8H]MBC2850498.1 energy transducer TonB [Cetobacterium sp. 8H]